MRICTEKSTGKLIEMQSDATEGTLIQNAISSGYKVDDVEEKVASIEEYEVAVAITNAPLLAIQQAEQTAKEQRDAEIASALPTWQAISDSIDAATTIAALKVIVKKLARVTYLHIKNSAT